MLQTVCSEQAKMLMLNLVHHIIDNLHDGRNAIHATCQLNFDIVGEAKLHVKAQPD